jgi:tetratricopeptide (TPR) repeat protein
MSVDVQISGDREVRLQSGISLAQAGKLEDATAEFNALLTGNSRDADALNNLAIVYRRQGKSQDALGALLDAVDIDPTRAEFQYNLGKVYKQLGNFKSAAMACAKAVESEPSLIPAYINLGAAYYLLNEFGKAANFFKKGLDTDPANEILQANYEAALKAKQAAESSSADDVIETEISEADDIFLGVPAGAVPSESIPTGEVDAASTEAESAANTFETASPYTVAGVIGLLRYFLGLEAFFPAPAQRVFKERKIDRRIKGLVDALASLTDEAPQAIPETWPAAEPEPAAESTPADDQVSIASLTNMLNHLGKLAQDLPYTEQRDTLKRKVENLIEGLNATALR